MSNKIKLICPACKEVTEVMEDFLMNHESLYCGNCGKMYSLKLWKECASYNDYSIYDFHSSEDDESL